jgi:hypothetical protein
MVTEQAALHGTEAGDPSHAILFGSKAGGAGDGIL